MERLTRQKKCILDYLQNTKIHPTADEVYSKVRQQLPQISKGTIYRNLDLFVQSGLIKEISGSQKRFDADLSSHSHFCCEVCEKIIDIYQDIVLSGDEGEINQHGTVTAYSIYFYGRCNVCQ